MKFKKVVSLMCSATFACCGVNAEPVDMKSKLAKMREESGQKAGKSLITAENLVRNLFWPGSYSKEGEEILKARGVHSLLTDDEDYSDIVKILESLDKDPGIKNPLLEFANCFEVLSWAEYIVRCFLLMGWASFVGDFLIFAYKLASGDDSNTMKKEGNDSSAMKKKKVSSLVVYLMLILACNPVISTMNRFSLEAYGAKEAFTNLVIESERMRAVKQQFQNKAKADSFVISDLNRSSLEDYGIKEALTNLVTESGGMRAVKQQFQNKAKAGVVSGNPKVESAKLNPSKIVKDEKTLDERKNKKVKNNKMLFEGGVRS